MEELAFGRVLRSSELSASCQSSDGKLCLSLREGWIISPIVRGLPSIWLLNDIGWERKKFLTIVVRRYEKIQEK